MQLGGLVQVLNSSRLSLLPCQMRSTEARIRDCEMRPLVTATLPESPLLDQPASAKYPPSFHRQDWSKIRTIAVRIPITKASVTIKPSPSPRRSCWVKIRSDRVAGRSASQRNEQVGAHASTPAAIAALGNSISANRFGEQYRCRSGNRWQYRRARKVLGGCQHRIGLAPRIKALAK